MRDENGRKNASHALFPNMKYLPNYTTMYTKSRSHTQMNPKKYDSDPRGE